ncbi:MAG: homoserine kinase [Proteobacteria bacterium]|nr:homoserine kinase [Pseudomonadota bacterium]
MAVYTEVPDDELAAFLAQYDIGRVVACKGIAEGVENSNYLLQTERDTYILTLYERRVVPEDLPYFLGLMEYLAARGIPCPTPIRGRDGKALRALRRKPAAIVSFLAGVWHRRLLPEHCAKLGTALARMHLAGRDFPMARANDYSLGGWRTLFERTAARAGEVSASLAEELEAELRFLEGHWPEGLPTGNIHADLFPDNVFFLGEEISGLIDFYFACTDFFAYDIAVCLNAWCFEPDLTFNTTKALRLLASYRRVRKIEPAEAEALPVLVRGSALRFLLTRLYDWLNRAEGALVTPKDPREFLRKLRFHQRAAGPALYGLQ